MRSSLPASWATTQIESNPAATPSGPAPVLIVATTSPVAGSSRSSSLPSNDVTQTDPYAAVVRSGTPGTSTVRSGSVAPAGIRSTVSLCAPTTHTAPSSVVVRPTGPVGVSTYGASSTGVSVADGSDGSVADGSAASGSGSESEQAVIASRARSATQTRSMAER